MILSKWAGDSEKAISGVFDIAKSFQPCIIFLVSASHARTCDLFKQSRCRSLQGKPLACAVLLLRHAHRLKAPTCAHLQTPPKDATSTISHGASAWQLNSCCCLCALLQDEVDSLGQSRGSSTDAGARRLLTELLIQFTRAAGEEGVYVFGATNRMQVGCSRPACCCTVATTGAEAGHWQTGATSIGSAVILCRQQPAWGQRGMVAAAGTW
jgi:hypothetical protein